MLCVSLIARDVIKLNMCTGAESRGIIDTKAVSVTKNSKVEGEYHEINGIIMRSKEGGEGTRNISSSCYGRFVQQLHHLLHALFPISLSEVRRSF